MLGISVINGLTITLVSVRLGRDSLLKGIPSGRQQTSDSVGISPVKTLCVWRRWNEIDIELSAKRLRFEEP